MQPPPLPTRRKWTTKHTVFAILGVLVSGLVAIALLVAGIFALISTIIRSTEPYQFALKTATADERIIECLGEPIETGWRPNGSINIRNSRGNANLHIKLTGPEGDGSIEVVATKTYGKWTYQQLTFHDHQTRNSFSLLQQPSQAQLIRVLIIDGFSNHNWQLNTRVLRETLLSSGNFDVHISTAPPTTDSPGWNTWRPDFASYNVVIQTCNDIGGGPSWPDEVKQDFEAFVRNGGGIFIHHSANNAFPDWDAYNQIIGLGWRKVDQGTAIRIDEHGMPIRIPAGEGKSTGHGPRVDATITRIGEHPIHSGLPRQWRTPDLEIYHHPRGPAINLQVLSFATDPATKLRWPIEWTVHYGKGRAYNATYGHVWHDDEGVPDRMRCAAVQTLTTRAALWLAGEEDQPTIPEDFPTADRISLR